METILSYVVYWLKVSRDSTYTIMEMEFLFSQKLTKLTASSLKNGGGGRGCFRGMFFL